MLTYIKELMRPFLKKTFHRKSEIMTIQIVLKYLEAWIILLKPQMNSLKKMQFLLDWLCGPLKCSVSPIIWTDCFANFLSYCI